MVITRRLQDLFLQEFTTHLQPPLVAPNVKGHLGRKGGHSLALVYLVCSLLYSIWLLSPVATATATAAAAIVTQYGKGVITDR